MQILLFLKELEQKMAVARVDIPVDRANVIAGRELTVVRKLQPGTLFHAAPLRTHATSRDLARKQVQSLQLLEEIRREKFSHDPGEAD